MGTRPTTRLPRPLLRQTTTIADPTQHDTLASVEVVVVGAADPEINGLAEWGSLPELDAAGWHQVSIGELDVYVRITV
jgi:hypothetical protein